MGLRRCHTISFNDIMSRLCHGDICHRRTSETSPLIRSSHYAASAPGSLYRSPFAIIAHAIRAILLASAMAATLVYKPSIGVFGLTDAAVNTPINAVMKVAVREFLLRESRQPKFTGPRSNLLFAASTGP